jgi:hypothetical protein
MADIGSFYRFDRDLSDPARLRQGAGYVINDRVRVEIPVPHAVRACRLERKLQVDRQHYRVNFKVGFKQGLLGRVFDGGGDIDAD